VTKPRLHLDADTSIKALHTALLRRGHDVTRTPSYAQHGGIILAAQRRWTRAGLIAALDRLLAETQAEDWSSQVRWLNDWL
jgi:hypothetical protein